MTLAVLHYHFRPGGVRRVIENGLPALVAEGCVSRVVMAAGEAPDAEWRRKLEATLHPCGVEWLIEPSLGYWSEQSLPASAVRTAVRAALQRITTGDSVLWAHNLSVGRNMILAQEVAATAGPVWLHHHDWWWDGRWERWPEMEGQGIGSLSDAMAATLSEGGGGGVRHFCINADDARRLREWTGGAFHFLPNSVSPEPVTLVDAEAAREFLRRVTGRESWWLYPCRGLRRKNIAEALLVQRCLAPDAVTVTTGGASSAAEREYFATLTSVAERHGWPLRAGVCADGSSPPVSHLLAAADAVVVTSLREGFGLPYGEAAGRLLAARIPSGLDETLQATGFTFRNGWKELRVPPGAFDSGAETARTAAGRLRLLEFLPAELHQVAAHWPAEGLESPDFGALSLTAQLEVLSQPVTELRRDFLARNPALRVPLSPQPPASKMMSPQEWARALFNAARQPAATVKMDRIEQFLAPALDHWQRHPLLWGSPPPLP